VFERLIKLSESNMTGSKKTVEDTYKKLTQREHILHRGNMYIGHTTKTLEEQWVFDENQNKMIKKMIEYTPGFLKIFDEILTNATDHAVRDTTVTTIKVDISSETGEITVWNNGNGIPVVEHQEHKVFIPELIFGNLLTSSNYNDNEKRVVGGLNGAGSKLTNIYSKKFVIETVDSERQLKYKQEFNENMSQKNKPKITKYSGKSYTQITFLPDYPRFHMKGLEKDSILLLKKRVVDCIACSNKNVTIFLNGEKLKGKNLQDYSNYFIEDPANSFYDKHEIKTGGVTFVWEYLVIPYDKYEQVSFVNGINTTQGGKHVDYILQQVTTKLKGLLENRKKLKDVKMSSIKERMFLFLRATIVNPTFTSQTKEYLTTSPRDFGCKIEVSDKFVEKVYKSSITEEIVSLTKLKESLELSKQTDGKKKSVVRVPKLEDAAWAGTAKSNLCTLILTEGESAKTFAMWGRSVVGVEKYAVYALRGKGLNVRDASVHQLINNAEIGYLKQIIGLKQGKDYSTTNDLRYGKVLLLTDSDVDGSHIKSLIMNMFHFWWPSLLKLGFLQTMKTPIVKAMKGTQVKEFFTQQDYEKWYDQTQSSGTWKIKYFKGLGTSKKEDAKDCFKRINDLQVDYYYKDTNCDKAILLAFEKDKNISNAKNANPEAVKYTDLRKNWLSKYDRNIYLDVNTKKVSIQDFIHKDLIHFSNYDNLRSIPSLCDGLKPSQRKILYYCLKKKLFTNEIKVAQLSGYISAETSYHHGEASLQMAIINMCQDFVGTNNIHLLLPDSNMGSRYLGGKDAASPRYIYTKLNPVTIHLFHSDDANLLKYLEEDGMSIEPEWFVPVLPMALVNGCEGIGTGYSTYIPPYNPKDIIENIYRLLDDKEPIDMKPYWKGFKGQIESLGNGNYQTRGLWKRLSDTQVSITEIPVGTWVTPYKEFLESLTETDNKKEKPILKDVSNKTTDENTGINFLVEFSSKSALDKLISSGLLEKELKLIKPFSTNNMYLFSDDLSICKYKNATDILLDFYDIRFEFYEKRKKYLITKLSKELEILLAKVRFITEYLNGTLDINKKSKDFITNLLESRNYPKFSKKELSEVANDESQTEGILSSKTFDYLIYMPIFNLSLEKINVLEDITNKKDLELKTLKNTTIKQLWRSDLEKVSHLL
jgi:DNA topoisomerase II